VDKVKKYIILILLLLIGLSSASLTCTGDTTPNLGTWLTLNCSTMFSQSRCYAKVNDNSSPPILIDQYPESCFGEYKICINTFDDGSFTSKFFMDDKKYKIDTDYSIDVRCFNPEDNSTNTTLFNFHPANYAYPNWIMEGIIFFRDNSTLVIVGFVITILILGFLMYLWYNSR
jgi:hypothetical protein